MLVCCYSQNIMNESWVFFLIGLVCPIIWYPVLSTHSHVKLELFSDMNSGVRFPQTENAGHF